VLRSPYFSCRLRRSAPRLSLRSGSRPRRGCAIRNSAVGERKNFYRYDRGLKAARCLSGCNDTSDHAAVTSPTTKASLHVAPSPYMPSSVTMADQEPTHSEFARLYRATLAPLRRYLTRFLGDADEAQDIAHDAYVRVYPRDGKAPPDNPQAFLYTTARNLAINRIKRRHIAPFNATDGVVETAPSPLPGVVQQVMARQELSQLEAAIAELPPGCRSVLLLRKVELLSHQEIADRLGIAVSTVEKQHARALRLLRTNLSAKTDFLPVSRPGTAPEKEASS
jgi:RNA polymerase sigma factor (sigma-70 family)